MLQLSGLYCSASGFRVFAELVIRSAGARGLSWIFNNPRQGYVHTGSLDSTPAAPESVLSYSLNQKPSLRCTFCL